MGLFRKNKKKQDKENIQEVNSRTILVRIYRKVGVDMYAQAAEFKAEEKPDANTNVLAINEDKNFKESMDFSKDRVYEMLSNNLKIIGLEYTKQEKILADKIKEKEDELRNFYDNDEEVRKQVNSFKNFQDEDLELRQLRVLRDSLKYQKLGSYVRLGANGIRVYEFESRDGVLYPFVFGGTKSPRAHPDLTVKKKIFNQENTIFNQQMGLNLNKTLTWIAVIMIAIACVWSLGNGFWTYKNWLHSDDMELRLNGAAITCNNAMSKLVDSFGNSIEDYSSIKQDIETLKKKESDNNNNKDTEINIDPNKK